MAKLDLIVPHYKEDIHLMDPMFGILRLQRNVKWTDFRVLIVCDGEDIEMPKDFGKDEPFEVEVIYRPHRGIAATRNAGLDYSQAEWIMFCDSDDAFLMTTSLETFLRYATDDKAMVASAFLEEAPSKTDDRMMLLWHNGKDYVFVHGKMFRRQWLKDNNIRFNDEVKLHEDSFFIAMARYHLKEKDIVWIKDMLYLWQYNPQSVTRKCDNFVLETYDQLIKKNAALTDELLRRGMYLPAKGIVCRTITDAYCRLNAKSWNLPGNEEMIRDAEDCVALFLQRYDYIYKAAGEKVIRVGLESLYPYMEKNGEYDGRQFMPFDEWVENLRKNQGG